MLVYIYWAPADGHPTNSLNDMVTHYETVINVLTLLGSFVGQLLFGFLADKFGRKRLYGLELIVVLFGTIGIVQCSAGYVNGNDSSMSIFASICFWRFLIGVGIGAEYPISATIAAEYMPSTVVSYLTSF